VYEPLAPGIYETPHSQGVSNAIEQSALEPAFSRIQPDDEPHVLTRHIAGAVERHLTAIKGSQERVAAANAILPRGFVTLRCGTY